MLKRIARCESFCGVLGEQLADQVFGYRAGLAKPGMVERYIGSANLVVKVWSFKRVRATDHVVHKYAGAPNVQWLSVGLIIPLKLVNLWREVIRCSHHELTLIDSFHHLGQAKVNDSDHTVFDEEAVLGLEIPMHHVVTVDVM